MPSLSVSRTCMDSPMEISTLSSSFSMRSRMPLTLSASRFWPTTSFSSAGRSTCGVVRMAQPFAQPIQPFKFAAPAPLHDSLCMQTHQH